jgi:serine/threonine protein kinase
MILILRPMRLARVRCALQKYCRARKEKKANRIETAFGIVAQFKDERAILMEIDHPNIVKLEGVYYESEDCIYLVQELCSGGDLFDRLDAQPEEHYSEAQCARLVKQMLSAVRSIADLKLDFCCV